MHTGTSHQYAYALKKAHPFQLSDVIALAKTSTSYQPINTGHIHHALVKSTSHFSKYDMTASLEHILKNLKVGIQSFSTKSRLTEKELEHIENTLLSKKYFSEEAKYGNPYDRTNVDAEGRWYNFTGGA